eukprot:TRINITY_DN56798_c0_g1_i1.p1 TRINITY_DN56798_c0_g1~~TRINITY_DN56798_c0_g1_i1.p1  ORF type:complete len:304 (+),score=38.47 TRINITY_DN56798_c0_g1_i1:36-947(+)
MTPGLLRLSRACGKALEPSPSVVARLVRDWIDDAQKDAQLLADKCGKGKAKSETRHIFGSLDMIREDLCVERLDVYVQLKSLFCKRQILLHFYPSDASSRSKLKDRTETALVYFDACSGGLHGLHISPDQRGRGLMKALFLYYVLFCRDFDLPATTTGVNKKPLFAKLYVQMGYSPCCTDFPFLLLPKTCRNADANDEPEVNRVVPLPAENARQDDNRREGDRSWTFSPAFAQSQGLAVVQESVDSLRASGQLESSMKLYAKTSWELPDAAAVSRRDAVLDEVSQTVNCSVYVDYDDDFPDDV